MHIPYYSVLEWGKSDSGRKAIDESAARMRKQCGSEEMHKVQDEIEWLRALRRAAGDVLTEHGIDTECPHCHEFLTVTLIGDNDD